MSDKCSKNPFQNGKASEDFIGQIPFPEGSRILGHKTTDLYKKNLAFQIATQVLAGQSNLQVAYFKKSGNALPSPLPNPYTDAKRSKKTITVRVTNY